MPPPIEKNTSVPFLLRYVFSLTLWFEMAYGAGQVQIEAPEGISAVGWFPQAAFPQALFLPRNILSKVRYT